MRLRGTITDIRSDTLNAEVAVAVSDGTTIYALVTNESVRELGLCVGREAILLIKAPFVVIVPGEGAAQSVRNCVRGMVQRCETRRVSAEVVLDIGDGKTLAATITAHSAKALGLRRASRPARCSTPRTSSSPSIDHQEKHP